MQRIYKRVFKFTDIKEDFLKYFRYRSFSSDLGEKTKPKKLKSSKAESDPIAMFIETAKKARR